MRRGRTRSDKTFRVRGRVSRSTGLAFVEFAGTVVENDTKDGEEDTEAIEKGDRVAKVKDRTHDHKDPLEVAGDCVGDSVGVTEGLEGEDVLHGMTEASHHKQSDEVHRRNWISWWSFKVLESLRCRSFKDQHHGDVDDEGDGGRVEGQLGRVKVVFGEELLAVDVL